MEILTSLAIILLSALLLGSICKKIKLPPLIGMLIIGIILGPYALNLIAPSIVVISADLRQLALVIILSRAGLSLNFNDLRKNERSAVLMCFLPAIFEIGGYILLGTWLLKMSILDAAILGCVMAAVSPAVVVPQMLKLTEQGYGVGKGIPQMIMAGASVDDIFVITLFTSFTGMATGGEFSWNIAWQIPLSIILGISVGIVTGIFFSRLFKRFHIRDTVKVIILLSFSFLFIALEHLIAYLVPYASLLSVISMGAILFRDYEVCAKRLSSKYNKLWVFAEILLFVLVGATVDIKFAISTVGLILLVIVFTMIIRMIGVYVCLIKSKLNQKERLFSMIAYLPKATVQAAIGAIPLSLGLVSGPIILTAAVVAILITAPLGAFLIDLTYQKLLKKDESPL